MSKSFYVVCRQARIYSSRQDFNVAAFVPVFGSSDYKEISECVSFHNKELDDFLNSGSIVFPCSFHFYELFEISNLD